MRLSDKNLSGRTVIASNGRVVGHIAALILESDAWRIESIVVELTRDSAALLGVKHGRFRATTVEVPTALVQSVGDAVVLSVSTDQLRTAPSSEPAGAPPP